MLDIDPKGRFATPVVTVSSATAAGPRTTAVEPEAFARIARWAGAAGVPKPDDLAQLTPPPVAPVRLTGDRVEVHARVTAQGIPRFSRDPVPDLAPIRLVLGVETQDGLVHPVSLGVTRPGLATYRAAVPCSEGCLLRTVTLARTFGDFVDANVKVDVSDLSAGTGTDLTPVDLDATTSDAWQPLPLPGDAFGDASVVPGPAARVRRRLLRAAAHRAARRPADGRERHHRRQPAQAAVRQRRQPRSARSSRRTCWAARSSSRWSARSRRSPGPAPAP